MNLGSREHSIRHEIKKQESKSQVDSYMFYDDNSPSTKLLLGWNIEHLFDLSAAGLKNLHPL